MQRVDPPYPSISFVFAPPEPRNARSSRLPAYRSSYMVRYHPYPRSGRASCQERLTSAFDYRYEEELMWEREEPLVVPPSRVASCTEVPDSDASPFDDEPLLVDGGDPGSQGADPAAAMPATSGKLVAVTLAFYHALLRRYYERVRALKDLLLLDQ